MVKSSKINKIIRLSGGDSGILFSLILIYYNINTNIYNINKRYNINILPISPYIVQSA